MSIEIQVELKSNYIHVGCTGTRSSNALLETYDSSFRIAESEECAAVLVDIRELTGPPPKIAERFEQGARVAELQQTRYRGIAFALVGNEPMIDPTGFGETVARNRGCIGRTFTDFDEAVSWIEKKARAKRTMW